MRHDEFLKAPIAQPHDYISFTIKKQNHVENPFLSVSNRVLNKCKPKCVLIIIFIASDHLTTFDHHRCHTG